MKIKYFAIAALTLLGASGLQGMLRRPNFERRMRVEIGQFVNQRNIQELNNVLARFTAGQNNAVAFNRFHREVNDAAINFYNQLLLGTVEANQANITFLEQLTAVADQAAVAVGMQEVGPRIASRSQIVQYIRNNDAQGLAQEQINFILADIWLLQLQHQLEIFARINGGRGDLDAINNLLRANFDGTHLGREGLRAQVIQALLGNQHLTDETRAEIQGFVDALPGVRISVSPNNPIRVEPINPVNPRPTQSGNWFSNHKVATVFGVTAVGALGYYLYTKWQKSKKKKSENKEENKNKTGTRKA